MKRISSYFFLLTTKLCLLKCTWQIYFICLKKSSLRTNMYSKEKNFNSDFPSPCFNVPKTGDWERLWRHFGSSSFAKNRCLAPTFSYFLINSTLLYHFLANCLAHNKQNMSEKSVFREALSPEMTSQSFPVSCFCFWYSTGSEI